MACATHVAQEKQDLIQRFLVSNVLYGLNLVRISIFFNRAFDNIFI